MARYQTSVDIAAPVAVVWAVTLDVESWPSWSPTMDEVTREGSRPETVWRGEATGPIRG